MARGVKEGNLFPVALYHVSSDMLGNPPCLPVNHMGVSDGIQQGGFPMVYMAHDADNWRAFYLDGNVFFLLL